MLSIVGEWIIITIGRIAVWTIWPRQRLRRNVLKKAECSRALLKTRRICVIYSHNNWYIKRGQGTLPKIEIIKQKQAKTGTADVPEMFTANFTGNPIKTKQNSVKWKFVRPKT